MPQNGLQFLLMIPTTLPVGFLAASAADILNCSDTQEYGGHLGFYSYKDQTGVVM